MEALKLERAAFERLREVLVREHHGDYALVQGDRLLGTFPLESDALREGYRAVGDQAPFLVRRVERAEEEVPVRIGVVSVLPW